jgi:hypothetical protein
MVKINIREVKVNAQVGQKWFRFIKVRMRRKTKSKQFRLMDLVAVSFLIKLISDLGSHHKENS